MFRVSLRSFSDRFREHVCVSCLAQGLRSRNHGLRPFYSTAISLSSYSAEEIRTGVPDKLEKKRANPQSDPRKKPTKKRAAKPRPKPAAPRPSKGGKVLKTQKEVSTRSKTVKSSTLTARSLSPRSDGRHSSTAKATEPPFSVFTSALGTKEGGKVNAKDLTLKPLDVETAPVPRLSFGLERALFNPGVYHLRDPRSRVYNFDPYLGSIMPVTEFDFAALKDYITSSKDTTLRDIAQKEEKKYVGSSSSMTSTLSHFHYLLSAWRPIDCRTLSQGFPDKLRNFTRLLRAPAAMFLKYQDGVYAIDADKEFDSANILMNLGKSMEKLLTLPKEDFERYRRSSPNKITPEEEQAVPESYHYSTLGDFVMRSQLDAHDPRLPGTGMFDLKTRAVVSIRMDAQNFEHGVGYEIRNRHGAFESYEREFYDMIRAAFLKYSLQVRIGRMDGIFVAFHNIQRIFGFQYVSLPEMDLTLHGQSDTTLGDQEFRLSVTLWNKVLDKVTARFPKQSVRLHFETRPSTVTESFMYIFAEPVTDDEIHAIQTKNQEAIDAYQRRILDLDPLKDEQPTSTLDDSQGTSAPATNNAEQSDAVQNEEQSPAANDSPATPEETANADEDGASAENIDNQKELYGITLIIRNKVNGKFVTRPERLTDEDEWTVEYGINDNHDKNLHTIYQQCKNRRAKALLGDYGDSDRANDMYLEKLRKITLGGRRFREQEEIRDKSEGVVVLDDVK